MPRSSPLTEPGPRKRRAWDARNPGNAALREEVARAALSAVEPELRGGRELLDAGCGMGWWLRRLGAAGVARERLHGIELLEPRVRKASGAGIVRAGDVRALPYEDGRFGAVFLFTVLSSLPDARSVETAVREAWRVLAPGGALVIWEPRVPTPNRGTRLIAVRAVEAAAGAPAHCTTLTLLPPLARRLGRAAPRWYPRLARVPALRTHRLLVLRRTG